jgi:hypothetical protein
MRILVKIGTKIVLAGCLLMCAMALPTWSDTLILRDGTTLSGTLIQATTNTITFRTPDGQQRRYLVRDVDTVQFGDVSNGATQNQPSDDRGDNRGYDNGQNNGNNQDYGNGQNSGNQPNYGNQPNNASQSNGGYPNDQNNQSNQGNQGYDEARMERVIIPAGAQIAVRTNQSIDSHDVVEGQTFSAQLEEDVRDESGTLAIPRGSDVMLVTRRVENSGDITLDIDSITVEGRRYRVSTVDQELENNRDGVGANKRTGQYVGGGAVLGAIIGAIAGGGKGAAIGAIVGGGAGATAQIVTRGKEVHVPAETVLRFQLDHRLRLRLYA